MAFRNVGALRAMFLSAIGIAVAGCSANTSAPADACPGLEGTWTIVDARSYAPATSVCAAGTGQSSATVTVTRTGPSSFTWRESFGGTEQDFAAKVTPGSGGANDCADCCAVVVDEQGPGAVKDTSGATEQVTADTNRALLFSWTQGDTIDGEANLSFTGSGAGLPCQAIYKTHGTKP